MTARVAVLGAGLQGCAVALELARRGCNVHLLDRNPQPISEASLFNEGKIHLGYIYAKDRPERTARTMITGALHFRAAIRRWIDRDLDDLLSDPFFYAVHRSSMISVDQVERHMASVAHLGRDLMTASGLDYLGDVNPFDYRRLTPQEASAFADATTEAVFATQERSVDPRGLALLIREAIAAHPRIRFTGSTTVKSADRHAMTVETDTGIDGPFDHIVNALWRDRLRVDATAGIHPDRPWLFRFKVGVWLPRPESPPPSVSIVLGLFGDVVTFSDYVYLSWYPAGRVMLCADPAPPDPRTAFAPNGDGIAPTTLARLGEIVPDVANLDLAHAKMGGGYIFSWGRTDIDHPASELHQRHDIGPCSYGAYHTINTGKYTMAPYFALMTADRIVPA